MEYLDHLIKHTRAFDKRPWKPFLFDSHITHEFSDSVVKAHEHNIALYVLFSHLTHALQPLDVDVF